MPESNKKTRQVTIRYRGRGAQVFIYFGKLLRMFVYQNDWKVLPMAALIAGLVGMVVRKRFFINMEGTLMGAFAMVCVCIWNGCFNSVQVICRERDVIKREHRSGMHISSYIFSHMLYQALLCLAQTVITLFITSLAQVEYPSQGLITKSFMVDLCISMFLITFASDMLSLWVSTLAHSTTAAMTIMPFVLIFQLVFSGGMLTLPEWTKPLTNFTISNPALKVIAAQADTNNRPYATISNMLTKMRDNEIGATVTVGQVLDVLQATDNEAIQSLREKEIGRAFTLGELKDTLERSATFDAFRQERILDDLTIEDALQFMMESEEWEKIRNYEFGPLGINVGGLIDTILSSSEAKALLDKKIVHLTTVGDVLNAVDAMGLLEKYSDVQINGKISVGEAIDWLAGNADVQSKRDMEITLKTTLGKVLDLVGEDRVKSFLEEKAAAVSYNRDYECDDSHVIGYWLHLIMFIIVFVMLATITLEFIDKDKR